MRIRSNFVIGALAVYSIFLTGCSLDSANPANLAGQSERSAAAPPACQPDFALKLSPTAATISSGQSVRVSMALTSLCSFTGTVDVAIGKIVPQPGGNDGFSIYQSRYDIPLNSNGSGGAYVDLGATSTTLKTTYVLTITGKAVSGCCRDLSHSATFSLTVT